MTRPTMVELQKMLGSGIGLGLSIAKLAKKNRFKCCMIDEKLNSIELGGCVMEDYVRKPLMPHRDNGIDFIYTEESRQLTCNVHFSSIIVPDAEIATARLPFADASIQQ
jgi:hypothetical protein